MCLEVHINYMLQLPFLIELVLSILYILVYVFCFIHYDTDVSCLRQLMFNTICCIDILSTIDMLEWHALKMYFSHQRLTLVMCVYEAKTIQRETTAFKCVHLTLE